MQPTGEDAIYENPFVEVTEETNTNNVSLTSTSFAYTTLRECVNRGNVYEIKNLVRTEEMLNYFSYGYENKIGCPYRRYQQRRKDYYPQRP